MNTLLNFLFAILENIDYFGILVLIFLAAVTVVFAVFFLLGRRSAATERLSRLLPADKEAAAAKPRLLGDNPQGFVARVVKPLHDIVVPKEGATKKKARLKLIRAGFRSERAFQNFMASKVVFALLFMGIYLATRAFYRFTPDVILVCCLLAAGGFFLPNLFIWLVTKGRQDGMVKALPDALGIERTVRNALEGEARTRYLKARPRVLGEKLLELVGRVPTQAARERAAEVARQAAPGFTVINRLLVEGQDIPLP